MGYLWAGTFAGILAADFASVLAVLAEAVLAFAISARTWIATAVRALTGESSAGFAALAGVQPANFAPPANDYTGVAASAAFAYAQRVIDLNLVSS